MQSKLHFVILKFPRNSISGVRIGLSCIYIQLSLAVSYVLSADPLLYMYLYWDKITVGKRNVNYHLGIGFFRQFWYSKVSFVFQNDNCISTIKTYRPMAQPFPT